MSDVMALTITSMLEQISAQMCEEYCKWPEKYESDDRLYNEKCSKCPLNAI